MSNTFQQLQFYIIPDDNYSHDTTEHKNHLDCRRILNHIIILFLLKINEYHKLPPKLKTIHLIRVLRWKECSSGYTKFIIIYLSQ